MHNKHTRRKIARKAIAAINEAIFLENLNSKYPELDLQQKLEEFLYQEGGAGWHRHFATTEDKIFVQHFKQFIK